MATRSRIGYVLPDDSILSVYHHWDGYPEWLGVTLEDNEFDYEKQEFVKQDPKPSYYGGDDEAPILSKNLDEMARLSTDAEYLYLFLKGEWHAYSTDIKFDDDWNITGIITKPVGFSFIIKV